MTQKRMEEIRNATTRRYRALDDAATDEELDRGLAALGKWMESLPDDEHEYAIKVCGALGNEDAVHVQRESSLERMYEDFDARERDLQMDAEEVAS